MTEKSEETSPAPRTSAYLYFASLYFVMVGVLYLWGYWSTFNVNILEYLSPTDVIRLTAYPIVSAFIAVAIGAVLGEITIGRRVFPPGAGRNTPTGRFLWKIKPILVLVYLALVGVGYFSTFPGKWISLSGLLAAPIAFFAQERDFLLGTISHQGTRSVVLFLLASLPMYAYGHGQLNAYYVVSGVRFDYVLSPIDQLAVSSDANPLQRVRFLGHSGDFLFFLDPITSMLAITKFQDDKSLLLRHFDASMEKSANVPTRATQVPAADDRPPKHHSGAAAFLGLLLSNGAHLFCAGGA